MEMESNAGIALLINEHKITLLKVPIHIKKRQCMLELKRDKTILFPDLSEFDVTYETDKIILNV